MVFNSEQVGAFPEAGCNFGRGSRVQFVGLAPGFIEPSAPDFKAGSAISESICGHCGNFDTLRHSQD